MGSKSSGTSLPSSSATRLDGAEMGARIRARRLQMELTQEQLAKYAGVKKAMISAIEVGRFMPSVAVLAAIGERLGCGVDELLWGVGGDRYRDPKIPVSTAMTRVADLPPVMKQFVEQAIELAETATKYVPQQFLIAPKGESWAKFAQSLEQLASNIRGK